MLRRSRFSVRPNVGTAGRTAATPQEAPSATQPESDTPKDISESSTPAAVTDTKSVDTPSEKAAAAGDCQNGEGTSSSGAVQRRKRFSIKPKVAPGRPSTLTRTPKSPVKAVAETPVEVSSAILDKPTTSSQTGTTAAPQGLRSPRRRRPSEESRQPKVHQKPSSIACDSPGRSAVPQAEESSQQIDPPADSGKQIESKSGSQVKEVPPRPPDKVPPSLPDKESVEISEKAKTLVSSKSRLSLSPSAMSLSRLLNDPTDLQRLAKAQKLRELLRQERNKEKKLKKVKHHTKEYTIDPTKMTMRDLIRYLPMSNPMTSSLEESAQENETVVPPSPGRDESPESAQEPEAPPKMVRDDEDEDEQEDEDALMVPQVKVAEDGSLIIDEESLTVEVLRAKGPNPAHDRDPIFECGSTTTYSSFRKGTHSKPWSSEETDMFLLAISMVGTDFSMICQLFPHRARSEIKNKFKKEERENSWRIDKAFRERRKLDIEYFSKLLEKVLEVQKNKKKLKSLAQKNPPKKSKRKAKGKKAARKLSDVEEEEEEEEEDETQILDLEDEEEGEKENEDLCNEGEAPVTKPKRQRKRKSKQADGSVEPDGKKNKIGENSNEQGEACIPEDAEAALPEDHTSSDMSEKTENVTASKDTPIKPAKLSRGRAPKPLLPLGRKWSKKPPPAPSKTKNAASDKEEESDGASKEQVDKDSSPVRQANKRNSANAVISSEEEDNTVQPPRPTRYGRVPKPTKTLTYPAKEDARASSSDSTSTPPVATKSKPKGTSKRGRSPKKESAHESKKPKLVTLRASQSEHSDEEDEDEKQQDEEEIGEEDPAYSTTEDSTAPVFVPASLRSPHPVIPEVEETMEELDILANMPDVLGISQDALCPDASCERAQNEAGTAEPCEHQLDLLVDVIDFLSSEHTEVTEDESYNEAAQTLLTIGNLTHLPQSAQNQVATEDHATATSVGVKETRQHLEEETASQPVAQEQDGATCVMSDHGVTETSESVTTVEPQNSTADTPVVETSDQMCGEQMTVSDWDSTPQLQSGQQSSVKSSPQIRTGRLSKVKPKPNLGRTSRAAQPKSQPVASREKTGEEINAAAAVHEESTPNIPECPPTLSADDNSCAQVKFTEALPVSQETSVDQVESSAATSDQSSSGTQSHSFSDAQFVPSGEQASRDRSTVSEPSDEKVTCHIESIKHLSDDSATPDAPGTESQAEQGSKTDSVPPVDLPVSQKMESEVTSACQSRRSRVQKVKPKPNLKPAARTARLTAQTTKDTVEQDSSPTPISRVQEKTIAEAEPEATCSMSPEKPSQTDSPASILTPSLDLCSTLTPTKELSVTVEERTGATSDQSSSDNQSLPEASFEPRSRDIGSESTDGKGTSKDDTAESSNNLVTSNAAVTQSQTGQASAPVQEISDHPATCVTSVEDVPTSQNEDSEVPSPCQARRGRLQKLKPKPNLAQTSRSARSKPQITKDPVMQKQLVERPTSPTSNRGAADNTAVEVEAQPICSITLPVKPSQNTSTASVSAPSLELCATHKPTDESSITMEQKTDVGPNSSSESSEPNVPQRRRHSAKVKPNLGSSTRTAQTKFQPKNINKPSEQRCVATSSNITSEESVDSSQTELKLQQHSTTACSTLNAELRSTKSAPPESEKTLDSTNDEGTSSDDIAMATSWVAENQSMLTDSILEHKSNEKSTFERESTGNKMSHNDRVEAGPASQQDCKLDMSTQSKTQSTQDPAANVQSSESDSTELKINSVLNADSMPDRKESSPESYSERDLEIKSQEQAKQCAETSATNQTSNNMSQSGQSSDDTQSEPTDSSKVSRKASQTRRGRLIKPKPNLGRGSRPPQPQQLQSTAQAEADSATHSDGVEAAVPPTASAPRPDTEEPAEGAVGQRNSQESPDDAGSVLGCWTQIMGQLSEHDSPTNDAGSSQGAVTQLPDSSSQDTPSLSTEGTQNNPCLTIFSDMLSEQVPSDPDEPFFILSLTEIPVCSSGEVVDSAAESIPYLPVADASIQQQSSVTVESLAAVGGGSLSDVPVPVSMEERGEIAPLGVKDTRPDAPAYIDSIVENPVNPRESTIVQLPKLPETEENNKETEIPPTKQRLTGARAKLQVKPNTTRTKRAEKILVSNTNQDSEDPGTSMQPEFPDATAETGQDVITEPRKRRGPHANTEKDALAGRKGPKENNSGVQKQTTKTRQTSAGSSTAPSKDPSPGKAATKCPKVETPTMRKDSTPVASASHEVAPTSNINLSEGTHSASPATSASPSVVDIEQTTDQNQLCSDPNPSTSHCTAEVSPSQQSDCVASNFIEEEPTSVSQYFLSDIFTEVDEE